MCRALTVGLMEVTNHLCETTYGLEGFTLGCFLAKCQSTWSSAWTEACSLVWCHPEMQWILCHVKQSKDHKLIINRKKGIVMHDEQRVERSHKKNTTKQWALFKTEEKRHKQTAQVHLVRVRNKYLWHFSWSRDHRWYLWTSPRVLPLLFSSHWWGRYTCKQTCFQLPY